MRGHTARTPKKARAFLEGLRSTGGNISKACQLAVIGRQTVYEWRSADAEFAQRWDETLESAIESLEEEARRRAFEGTDEPVFYQGEVCGAVRKYSDTLLIFLLKAHKPERYRENIKISIDEIDSAIERELAALAAGNQTAITGTTDEEETVN